MTTQTEQHLAVLAVRLLRLHLVSDEDILLSYTLPDRACDEAYEAAYRADHGEAINAGRVKAHMRTLLTH